jgi:predicted  nucleic acid-binding Zn-ribbon protein
MSDTPDATVSWEFLGRRLDSVQVDVADVRRRLATLADRFGGIEDRISGLEARMSIIERRQGGVETRIDAMVERISGLEAVSHRALLLLERIAAKVAVEDQ